MGSKTDLDVETRLQDDVEDWDEVLNEDERRREKVDDVRKKLGNTMKKPIHQHRLCH